MSEVCCLPPHSGSVPCGGSCDQVSIPASGPFSVDLNVHLDAPPQVVRAVWSSSDAIASGRPSLMTQPKLTSPSHPTPPLHRILWFAS